MKISKKELLKRDTWLNRKTRTIITSDITWREGIGEIHHGFNMKARMDEASFEKALDWPDPGDYILENCPADGTYSPNRLERLTIDEAYELVSNDPDFESCAYHGNHHFTFEVTLYRGFGYFLNTPLAFEAKDEEEALVMASLADDAAFAIDEYDERAAEAEDADQWEYLDRSEYNAPNIYLNIENLRLERI